MKFLLKSTLIVLALNAAAVAQPADPAPPEPAQAAEQDELKIMALEALMSAPQERALPIVTKVLAGDNSDEVKSRALFVLSQIDLPEAQQALLETARNGSPKLRREAIRMIGIAGDPTTLAHLGEFYQSGDLDTKEGVLQAYLIAGDSNAVYELAANAETEEEFEMAVQTLGAMGATEELGMLRGKGGNSEVLIRAYSIAGDDESLKLMAMDDSNPELQVKAIQSLGVVGGADNQETLLEIYRGSDSSDVRQAALHGMMIGGYEQAMVELFRATDDAEEKRMLLQMLVSMGSDATIDLIDATLSER